MNVTQHGMLEATREFGGRVAEFGGHHLGAWEITWIVLGILLWAAVMTALVMGMIALVRFLKKPKGEKPEEDKSAK